MVNKTTQNLPLDPTIIHSDGFLDALREGLHNWSVALFDPATGGFRQNDTIGVNPMSSTDMIWIRFATHDLHVGEPDPDAIRAYLQGIQEPDTGRIRHDQGPGGQGHCDAHAFWQTVRVLNIIGAQLLHPPRFLAPVLTPDGLARWFDSFDWRAGGNGNHHEVLGLVPVLASLNDPAWTEVFFQKIVEQQNPENGAWPVGRTNISRTFAYTTLHLATGRIPPMPEKILDTLLELQNDEGVWESIPTRFHTMDAIYVLTRLAPRIGYREDDAVAALAKANAMMRDMFIQHQDYYCGNPHSMLAMTHTFGLLQETFPNDYPSEHPYRFGWDLPELYHSAVITRDMREV